MTEDVRPKGIRISQRDIDRHARMAERERALRADGYVAVAGVDEAGRGPLAGPVVAAACILGDKVPFYGLNDSKKMTAKRRDALYDFIREHAVAWAVAMVSPQEIDRTDILVATRSAMTRALQSLTVHPDIALIDAVALEGLDFPVLAEPKGDLHHNVVAGASVLAKVSRDRMMLNWDRVYPQYGFASHKGYGTRAHMEALERYGPCPIHRQSFLKNVAHKTMTTDKGAALEWKVAADLIVRGHTILEHRWRVTGIGEIDFITRADGQIYIVECKGRSEGSERFGGATAALGAEQVARIRRTAELWQASDDALADETPSFLYAACELDRDGVVKTIRYMPF
ncbi:MAG: ribonuclease HII [Saccharofermentanales bacterium]|jgi:ribonuclease HII